MHRLLRRVQLLDVQAQVCLPATSSRAQLTVEDRLVTSVNATVGLQRVALRESCITNVTLIRFLPTVAAQVPLQLEGVCGGIGALRALVRPLPRVAPHMPLQM